ncbi:pre-60S factor REI1 [Cryptococcus gattii Ru294]|uniref:Mitotic signaling network protein involved in bud growth, putative Rei1p n=1 Tax=Cryptococcus gattii serotype B (strain WM276 / ATCC MYA-4071) TaxID=367775 RepID=E6R1D9_CRYGW|nr:Mitotic signaling network protein involved in bud growth, putative; Rei1p [Cryptococcus gattii WM276]ADV20631.1 Mitotic signaling network protein involved in bud growth, putative; Rei1p [Cryptococcus gattii WM276]KIR50876.1 pre-60S factor REI1 [Cryptococcus gattii Ru294]KIY31242.1 pre-60S factor REI1 [Cryptococcus gattii E566]
MFTCISCRVAFESADEQRAHFLTDWHRYNMKRRVANLPPVAAASFNEKVLERREQNAVRTDPRSLACAACNKQFSSENAFRTHVQSKKHRDREATAASAERLGKKPATAPAKTEDEEDDESEDEASDMDVDGEDDEEGDFEQKMANLRRRIKPADCLFCTRRSETVDENVGHMASIHSFFIPDKEILIDLSGLLSYLGEKVAIGNLCLFCPNGGKEFGSLEAVRKHMIDKNHCKLAYETGEDRAELADFYDFQGDSDDEDWEDEDGEEIGSDEEVMDVSDRPQRPKKASVALAADGLSLVLPSGRTLGHRSLKVYYDQRYRPSDDSDVNQSALKVALVRKKLADPSLALVPVAGGHGAFGRGQQLMKARNAGEAKWAKKQGRNFQDQTKREQFKTKIGYIHNSQKHFRDPLLQ